MKEIILYVGTYIFRDFANIIWIKFKVLNKLFKYKMGIIMYINK